MRGQTRGYWWFWINSKHLFCLKKIPWARKRTKITVKSDDSSLFTGLRGWNLAQGMFFMQNKCLQWIQNHQEPLVWPLTCYLKHIFLVCFFPVYWSRWGEYTNGHNFLSQDFRQSRPLILCTLLTKLIGQTKMWSMSWHHRSSLILAQWLPGYSAWCELPSRPVSPHTNVATPCNRAVATIISNGCCKELHWCEMALNCLVARVAIGSSQSLALCS